jgi:hypothetical protein
VALVLKLSILVESFRIPLVSDESTGHRRSNALEPTRKPVSRIERAAPRQALRTLCPCPPCVLPAVCLMAAPRPPKDEEIDRRTLGNVLFLIDLAFLGCLTGGLAAFIALLSAALGGR